MTPASAGTTDRAAPAAVGHSDDPRERGDDILKWQAAASYMG